MNIPDFCYALNNTSIDPKTKIGEVIKIRALEKGYYRTSQLKTQDEVDEMSEKLGIPKPVSNAMETASMFGWEFYVGMLEAYERRYGGK